MWNTERQTEGGNAGGKQMDKGLGMSPRALMKSFTSQSLLSAVLHADEGQKKWRGLIGLDFQTGML